MRADGAPAENAQVLALLPSGLVRHLETDRFGRMRLASIPHGELTLAIRRGRLSALDDFETRIARVRVEPGESVDLELALIGRTQSGLRARVLDATGAPVAGTRLALQLLFRQDRLTVGPLDTIELVTDDAGAVSIAGLPPGDYDLVPPTEGSNAWWPARIEIPLGLDEHPPEAEFRRGRAITFAGALELPIGVAPSLIRLTLVDPATEERYHTVQLTADGRFLFPPVIEARYALEIVRGRELVESVSVGPEENRTLQITVR